jgi:hypothetical protein
MMCIVSFGIDNLSSFEMEKDIAFHAYGGCIQDRNQNFTSHFFPCRNQLQFVAILEFNGERQMV